MQTPTLDMALLSRSRVGADLGRMLDSRVWYSLVRSQRATAHTLQNVSKVNRERSCLAAASCVYSFFFVVVG